MQKEHKCVDCGKERLTEFRNGIPRHPRCRSCHSRVHHIIHGGRYTRLYHVWATMKERCSNPNSPKYKYYGKRGIIVCTEWKDFEEFQSWALSNGYQEGLSIDRIDNDGNYEPDNCRWLPLSENIRRRFTKGLDKQYKNVV